MRYYHPILKEEAFKESKELFERSMTIEGTINKTFFLLLLVFVTTLFTWFLSYGESISIYGIFFFNFFTILIVGILIYIFKKIAPYAAPFYAIFQGFVIGSLSAIFDYKTNGIATQVALLIFGSLLSILIAYRTKIIDSTEKFKLGAFSALGAILFVYIIDVILHFFKLQLLYIHLTGVTGLLISFIIVIFAAIHLVFNFEFIEDGAKQRAPKYLEWYGAFGLIVTLIWLFSFYFFSRRYYGWRRRWF